MSDASKRKVSVLLMGPLPIADDHLGGTKVSFQQMVNDLKNADALRLDIVNLSRPLRSAGWFGQKFHNFRAFLTTISKIVARGGENDVWAINISPNGAFVLGPIVFWLSRLRHKPLIVRLFGGSLDEDLASTSAINRWVFRRTIGRCEFLLLQTQSLVKQFESLGNVKWFPTTRDFSVPPRTRLTCRKLVFLSQIRKEKGLLTAIEAARQLPESCTFDVFGSAVDQELVNLMSEVDYVRYHGEAKPEDVPEILNQHDVLIFPTMWPGEGLPGVIIEAFQCGLPVIATRWKQIPEIVNDGTNGILIEPNSPQQLLDAIRIITTDDHLYQKLAIGARLTGDQYKSRLWHSRFADWCRQPDLTTPASATINPSRESS